MKVRTPWCFEDEITPRPRPEIPPVQMSDCSGTDTLLGFAVLARYGIILSGLGACATSRARPR